MVIKAIFDNGGRKRTVYYVAMSSGRAVTGGRTKAANFDESMGQKVLAHLKQIDHRFAEAELVAA